VCSVCDPVSLIENSGARSASVLPWTMVLLPEWKKLSWPAWVKAAPAVAKSVNAWLPATATLGVDGGDVDPVVGRVEVGDDVAGQRRGPRLIPGVEVEDVVSRAIYLSGKPPAGSIDVTRLPGQPGAPGRTPPSQERCVS